MMERAQTPWPKPVPQGEMEHLARVCSTARCAAIPARMTTVGIAFARQELHDIAYDQGLHKGVLPEHRRSRGNVLANLWFIRAERMSLPMRSSKSALHCRARDARLRQDAHAAVQADHPGVVLPAKG